MNSQKHLQLKNFIIALLHGKYYIIIELKLTRNPGFRGGCQQSFSLPNVFQKEKQNDRQYTTTPSNKTKTTGGIDNAVDSKCSLNRVVSCVTLLGYVHVDMNLTLLAYTKSGISTCR